MNIQSPIMICGCPGSGTSFVTRMLRHCGLFVGSDAGPANARKYHESQCYKRQNEQLLDSTIQFPHAPKSVEQFIKHCRQLEVDLEQYVASIDLDSLHAEFWADHRDAIATAWGWKDPRNSANALVWNAIYPELKAIVIQRDVSQLEKWKSRLSKKGTESGRWFRGHSTKELRSLYQSPPGLSPEQILPVTIAKLTTDFGYLKNCLAWCGLSIDGAKSFSSFLAEIEFER